MTRRKLRPGDPGFIEPLLERLRTMPIEELDALLTRRKEGVEVTNMNEELAQWYRRREAKKREAETIAVEPSKTKVA